MTQSNSPIEKPPIDCAVFFAEVPPGASCMMGIDLGGVSRGSAGAHWNLPRIQIYCDHSDCSGVRYFDPISDKPYVSIGSRNQLFVRYLCSNCQAQTKLNAIEMRIRDATTANIVKLGEHPSFGPPLSSKLLKLVGDSAELLKKGYRCEKDNLGIGAFGYYRRVLDQQRIRIFDHLIETSRTLGAEDIAHELENARNETQFKTAIEAVRHGLPQALYIEGHNPLTLLHSALSEGLHELPDDECLKMAADIRLVITELADRLEQLHKDDKELKAVVGRLSQKKKPRP